MNLHRIRKEPLTMLHLKFSVPGLPIAQPRARVTVRAGHGQAYTPKAHPVHGYKIDVATAARKALDGCPEWASAWESPIAVDLTFLLPRSKTTPKRYQSGGARMWHAKKPDVENIAKAFLDAGTGILWRDDAQVCCLALRKVIVGAGETPRTDVLIYVPGVDLLE